MAAVRQCRRPTFRWHVLPLPFEAHRLERLISLGRVVLLDALQGSRDLGVGGLELRGRGFGSRCAGASILVGLVEKGAVCVVGGHGTSGFERYRYSGVVESVG